MASSASLQCHSNKMSILLRLPPGETLRAASSKLGQIFMFLSLYSDSSSSSSSLPHKHTFYTGSTSFIFSNLKLRQLWFAVWGILPCWWGRLFSLFFGQSSDYNLSNNLTISYNWKQQQHLWCPEIILYVWQRGWHDKDICIQPALFWHLNAALWVPVHLHLWALGQKRAEQTKLSVPGSELKNSRKHLDVLCKQRQTQPQLLFQLTGDVINASDNRQWHHHQDTHLLRPTDASRFWPTYFYKLLKSLWRG